MQLKLIQEVSILPDWGVFKYFGAEEYDEDEYIDPDKHRGAGTRHKAGIICKC